MPTSTLKLPINNAARAGLLALALSGCVSTPPQTVEVEPVIISKQEFARLEVTSRKLEPAQRPATVSKFHSPIFSEAESLKSFSTLCKGGKPYRKVENKVTFVIPKTPAGVPLDKAAKLNSRYQQMMRAMVASFYRLLAFGHYQERLQSFNSNLGQDQMTVPGFPYLVRAAAYETKKSDVEDSLKENRVDHGVSTAWSPGMDPVGSTLRDLHPEIYPLLAETSGPKRALVMSFVPASFYNGKVVDDYSKKPPLVKKAATPKGYDEIIPFELLAIKERFALVVTEQEAKNWSEVARKRRVGNLDAQLPADAGPSGKMLPQSEMINSRDEFLEDYLVANTAVAESTTDDGQVFEFNLTLNTEPLCRAGRTVTELTSK